HFEAEVGGESRHNESGTTFVEIFSWSRPDAPQIAHNTPSIMAVWEPMGALVESRGGRPAMEVPHYRPLNLAASSRRRGRSYRARVLGAFPSLAPAHTSHPAVSRG